jgi:hypothetical protein
MNGCRSLPCCMLWNIPGEDSDDNFANARKNRRYWYFRTKFVSGLQEIGGGTLSFRNYFVSQSGFGNLSHMSKFSRGAHLSVKAFPTKYAQTTSARLSACNEVLATKSFVSF